MKYTGVGEARLSNIENKVIAQNSADAQREINDMGIESL